MSEEVVARLHFVKAGEWSPEFRKQIAEWLREQADRLEEEGDNYATNYRARYSLVDE